MPSDRDRTVILGRAPSSVLAVFAHPDDPEVACAGTLRTWVDRGCEARVLIANDGEKGSSDPAADVTALAARRRDEAERAGAAVGAIAVEFMGYPDGDIENDHELRARLIRHIRTVRPEAVIAPDPTAIFFGDSYVNHHDHRALGWAVLDVCGAMAAGALYEPDAGPPHQPSMLLLAGTLEPDTWVDVGGALDAKVAALRCHESQLSDGDDVVQQLVEARAAEAGRQAGVRYAEGFRRLSFVR